MSFAAVALWAVGPVVWAEEGAPAMSGGMAMPMKAHMEAMAKLKAALDEAKTAAQAEKATTTEAKVDDALKLLEQDHQTMHAHMAEMMKKMKGHMEAMKAMEQDMQKMKEEMGQKEETKPMEAKMEAMMKKMKEGMPKEEMKKDGEMKCPMCKKMMAEAAKTEKVVNVRCPITGNKIDADHVAANLTTEFKGQKVGFCCGACPAAWDKLSDQEKQEKLSKAVD